jgi:PleD family two-component response regulator
MNLTKEQVLSISYLKLSDWISDFDDGALLEKYCSDLSDFVVNFPVAEANLNKACLMDDAETIRRALSELSVMLDGIHASELAIECDKIKETFAGLDHDACEALLVNFLAAAASLSVDIQMEQQRSEEEPIRPKTRKCQAVHTGAPKSILAVDDISITLNMLKSALAGTDYKFHGVTSGAAALDFISKFTPDLFILDIEMPNMNGFELAGKIREAGHFAPIIFLTGNTARDYLLKAVKAGAIDFIVKPVNQERIIEKVKKHLAV